MAEVIHADLAQMDRLTELVLDYVYICAQRQAMTRRLGWQYVVSVGIEWIQMSGWTDWSGLSRHFWRRARQGGEERVAYSRCLGE